MILLAGCGGGSGNGIESIGDGNQSADDIQEDPIIPSVPATDRMTIAIVNNGHMLNMRSVAEAYTDQTGVILNWVALDEDVLRQQVLSETATDGSQYDVINIGMQEPPIWGAAGWIEPLSFSDNYDVNDVFPTMRTGLSSSGTLYGAPFYGESSMLMYRSDLANAAAVQINDNDSWDNVAAAAAAMHNPEEGLYGICLRGRPGWGDNVAVITTIANSFGAVWFDENNRPQLDSEEWSEAANFYVDLLSNYGPPNSERNSFNEILALFNNGQCGIWVDATIAASFLEIEEVTYAQSPEARKFIEWATSKEYIQAVANHPDFGWGSVPTGTRASTYTIPEFQEVARFAEAEKIAIESANPSPTDQKPYLGVQFASIPEFPELGTVLAQEMAAALSGIKSVDDALAAAQEVADQIMRDAGYY